MTSANGQALNTLSVSELQGEVRALYVQLHHAREALDAARALRGKDSLAYLARLVYRERLKKHNFNVCMSEFTEKEIERAQLILDTVGGDVEMAERVIITLGVG